MAYIIILIIGTLLFLVLYGFYKRQQKKLQDYHNSYQRRFKFESTKPREIAILERAGYDRNEIEKAYKMILIVRNNINRDVHGFTNLIYDFDELPPNYKENQKKDTILKAGPKTFYYLDQTQTNDLYPQAYKELEPSTIETQESTTNDGGAKVDIKFLEGNVDHSKTKNTKKTYDNEMTTQIKYNKVEEYLFTRDDVKFGIEDYVPDETTINAFKAMCTQMETKFNFSIPPDTQTKYIDEKRNSLANDRMKEVSETSGYVVLKCDANIIKLNENTIAFELIHPLSSFLQDINKICKIMILPSAGSLTISGSNLNSICNNVKITCVGKVICWDKDKLTLMINPIAIY